MMLALPGLAAAQTAAPPGDAREIPRPEQLEPGVATTPAAAAPSQASPAPAAAAAPPAASPASVDAGPAPAAKPAGKETTAAGKETTAKAAAHKGPDRLELDATDITGNRELPKVLYIVPWKRSDLGDVVGRPVNSLLDEVLEPLDRDVFQRQNRYYDGLKGAGGDAKAGAAQGSPGKP
ncbi:MAG TPA: hypothetical protein VMT66_05670 [Steroidobacteraceae bacterium]|nr:hypothetical protein [Steroidobacteraceae bacterium]